MILLNLNEEDYSVSKLILNFGNDRGRYLCECGIMYETSHYYHQKYSCKGCTMLINGEREGYYISVLDRLGYNCILQQYKHEDLLSEKGNKLSYDIALFRHTTDLFPYFLFEVLSYNNFVNSNQDGLRDNYINKTIFARDKLCVPMVELSNQQEDPESVIINSMKKYKTISKIENHQHYLSELNSNFYNRIFKRIGVLNAY